MSTVPFDAFLGGTAMIVGTATCVKQGRKVSLWYAAALSPLATLSSVAAHLPSQIP